MCLFIKGTERKVEIFPCLSHIYIAKGWFTFEQYLALGQFWWRDQFCQRIYLFSKLPAPSSTIWLLVLNCELWLNPEAKDERDRALPQAVT